jgi:hypothetical protein
MAEANMRYLTTGVTYRSHGRHEREDGEARAHESVLDHIYVARDLEAMVAVLSDSTTDHYPLVAAVKVNKVSPTLKIMKRRNFKGLERPALLQVLDAWPWAEVYGIGNPDKVLDFVTRGIDFDREFILTVDSSSIGVGAILSQFNNKGIEHPCAYGSRVLTHAKTNYSPCHLEASGLQWSTRHFRPYLIGRHFSIRRDHKPLVSMNKTHSLALDRI